MAGERTPDTTPHGQSGSSDDEISLREHMQRQIDAQREFFLSLIRAMDARLQERWDAQTVATQTAFIASERAVELRLDAHKEAIDKADIATEKRFQSVNEFRGQLNDQARTFMGREESLSRHERNAENMADMSDRIEKAGVSRDNRLAELEKFQAQWANIETRLHQLNDLRSEVQTDRAIFLRREMFDAMAAQFSERMTTLATDILTLKQNFVRTETFAQLSDRVSNNSAKLERGEGKSAGLDKGWALLVGAVGFLATIGGIVALVIGLAH